MEQVRAAIAKRQRFQANDKRAIQMFGREEFRPVMDGITIGLQTLLTFIGCLTLAGGLMGIALAYLLSAAIGPIAFVGEAYQDTTGRGDIRLIITPLALLVSTGVLSGLFPAIRASRLDPAEGLRYE
jgi:putative ABC transport system permease protein